MTRQTRIYFHIGYPKTGTTTLQRHVYPALSKIHYLGKCIPGFQYTVERLGPLINHMATCMEMDWDPAPLAGALDELGAGEDRRPLLVSAETLVHPVSADPVLVARRIKAVAPEAQIVVTLRAQQDLLLSFYRNHGAFGAYLYCSKSEREGYELPLSADAWLDYNLRFPQKNLLGLLMYAQVIDVFRAQFGPQNVHVLLYEDLRDQPVVFARKMAGILGADADEFRQALEGKIENRGLGKTRFEEVVEGLSRPDSFGDTLYDKPDPETAMPVAFSEDGLARIRSHFAASNRRLATLPGLEDIEARGYFLTDAAASAA